MNVDVHCSKFRNSMDPFILDLMGKLPVSFGSLILGRPCHTQRARVKGKRGRTWQCDWTGLKQTQFT